MGRTFLISQEDGQHLRATIVKAVCDYEGDLQRNSSRMRVICSAKDGAVECFFTCNKVLDHANKSEDDDLIECKFKAIEANERPLSTSNADSKGSLRNLTI